MKKYLLALLIPFMAAHGSFIMGQDFHLSQYDASLQYLNPALTGQYFDEETDFRANLNYRSQWGSIATHPFSTALFGVDSKYQNRWGLGGYIVSDKTGAGNYGTLNFMLSGSYEITQDPENIHNLLVGMQLGLIHKSFNPDNLTFDNQYSSTTGDFDQGMSSRETFSRNSLTGFDANLGVFYKNKNPEWKVHPFGGLAFLHIPRPNESFTAEKRNLPIRATLHAGSDITIKEDILVTPGVLFMKQGTAQEINFNALGAYHIKESDMKILLGFGYRVQDAVILQTGIDYKNNTLRMSYDINTSYLSTYTRGRGGFEITLIYRGKKEQLQNSLKFL